MTKKKEPTEESETAPQDTTTQDDEQTTEQLDRSDAPTTIQAMYSLTFPIVRSDDKKWLVRGRATVEQPDRHGTIFSYEGAKAAFARWKGNIREQHDSKKAVGTRVEYSFDDDEKGVYLLARVSKGAPLTWEKVLDGTLSDFSVSVIPAEQYGTNTRNWPKKTYNGKEYPYLPEYDYAEISLVDAGSAPGSTFTPIMRADGSPTDILTQIEEEEAPPAVEPSTQEETLDRAGSRLSNSSRAVLHDMRDKAMSLCGCDDCTSMMDRNAPSGMEREIAEAIERALETKLSAVYSRLQGIAGTLARSNANTSLESIITSAITRAVEAVAEAQQSSLSEVRADLSAVKETVDRIEKTPVPGAPVNTGALPRPAQNKSLATDPVQPMNPPAGYNDLLSAFQRASKAGAFPTFDEQIEAASAVLQRQPQARR